MGLFSCCMNDKQQSRSDSEARHARIVEIYAQAAQESRSQSRVPPPAYNEIVSENELGPPAAVIEKEPSVVTASIRIPQPSVPASPRTSICSIPSTRLTDITSVPTGATSVTVGQHWTGESLRSSLAFDSAPPSYYDGRSLRARSRSPHEQRQSEEQQQHHVTTDDWLEIVRRTIEVAEVHIQRLERA